MHRYMEILTMAEDERTGTYDNMLASTMRRAGGESFTGEKAKFRTSIQPSMSAPILHQVNR
jgi:hypothetical protein